MRRCLLLLPLVLGLLPWRQADAHPHVFIDWRVEPQVEKGAIVGIKLYWRFDDLYSDLVLETVDRDRDRKLSPPEIELVAKRTLSNLEKGKFYTHFTVDGRPWQTDKAVDFTAQIDGDHLIYVFTFALPAPAKQVAVSSYDPEYYIEMLADKKQPATGQGFGCKVMRAPPVKLDGWGTLTPDLVDCASR